MAETVVQAEVQAEFSLSEAELVEAGGKKKKKRKEPFLLIQSPQRGAQRYYRNSGILECSLSIYTQHLAGKISRD